MANRGLIPPGLTYLADNIISKGNLLGSDKATGARWARGLNLPKESETLFLPDAGISTAANLNP